MILEGEWSSKVYFLKKSNIFKMYIFYSFIASSLQPYCAPNMPVVEGYCRNNEVITVDKSYDYSNEFSVVFVWNVPLSIIQ
jgi:hypothetical protein